MSGGANLIFDRKDLMFRHPFNGIVYGASGSGKTEWVHRFIRYVNMMVEPRIESILYCYGVFDPRIFDLQRYTIENGVNIEVHQGLPSEELLKSKQRPLLLILDDLMIEAKSKFLTKLFTRDSHHQNISVLFITQNMFDKEMRTARNNAHYIVLMRNPAGELQIRNLGIQLFTRRLNYFMDAYQNATQEPFGYLMIDMHPGSPPSLRLRTHIYPEELPIVFSSKH